MGRGVSVPRANDYPPASALADTGLNEFGPDICVVPAKAGTQRRSSKRRWVPAFAGTTISRMPASHGFVTLNRRQSVRTSIEQASIHTDVDPYRRQSARTATQG